MNRHDIRVLQLHPQLAFAAEPFDVRPILRIGGGVAELAAQHFDRKHLVHLAMRGTKHAGERAGTHAVQHLVVAVEETGAQPAMIRSS